MDLGSIARDGVFSTADARVLGLGTRQLQSLERAGDCASLTRGWWSVQTPADDLDRHRLTCRALRRHFAGRAWLSHYSALLLKGLPADDADLGRVHLTRIADRQSRKQPAFTLHTALGCLLGERTQLAVAIVQTGGVTTALSALAAADAALHRGLVTPAELQCASQMLSGHPASAATRALLQHADGRHESPGETRTALVLRQLGIAATPQVELSAGGLRYRVDFLLDDAPVVIEFDGRVKYEAGDTVFAEKVREDHIRSWGFQVVRLTWSDLRNPARVARLIQAAVERARHAAR